MRLPFCKTQCTRLNPEEDLPYDGLASFGLVWEIDV